jgi:hypothetical protein
VLCAHYLTCLNYLLIFMHCDHERYLNTTLLSNTAGFLPAIGTMYFHCVMNILLLQNILDINPFLAIHFEVSVSIFLRIYCFETWLCWSPLLAVKTAKIIEVAKSHGLIQNKSCSYHRMCLNICINCIRDTNGTLDTLRNKTVWLSVHQNLMSFIWWWMFIDFQ